MKWLGRLFVAVAVIVGAVVGLRSLAPLATGEPVGRCISGAIDLNRPVPFIKLQLGPTTVALAVSGGGSRAAYLAAAILREIRRSGVRLGVNGAGGKVQSLLDQVDLMSAVSGGSLASAYFTTNADENRRDWPQRRARSQVGEGSQEINATSTADKNTEIS